MVMPLKPGNSFFALVLRAVLQVSLVIATLALAIYFVAVTVTAADAARPNILLVIADDMGLDASACYAVGNQQARMPNLEALCRTGMVFDNAYAAPTCSPTRATIMTGKYGFRTGIGGAITPGNPVGLAADEISLFDVLNRTGYASALIGKWHLAGPQDGLDHPSALGVDNYFGFFKGRIRDYYNWEAVENGRSRSISGYSTSVLTDRAIDWIAAQNSPWFLWLAHNAPHTPFHAPPANLHSYGDLPDNRRSIRQDRLTYYNAALQALDTELGRLLNSMTAETRANTVVIFIGDNGSPGQVARQLYGERGAKGGIFEGGTHVPLIAAGAGISRGRNSSLINSTDLFATIAGLAGADALPAGAAQDSISFEAALAGGAGTRQHAYVEHFTQATPRGRGSLGWAIRNRTHKLVSVQGEDLKLFDLTQDAREATDLLSGKRAGQFSPVVDQLINAVPQ